MAQDVERDGLQQPLSLKHVFASTQTWYYAADGFPVRALAEDDGTPRSQSILWDGSAQVRELAESDGTPRSSLYGTAPTDGISGIAVEDTSHELKTSIYGTDLDGTGDTQAWNVDDLGDGHIFITNASSLGVLAQGAPAAANTEEVLYVVPALVDAVITEIHVGKEGGGNSRFAVGISIGGGALVTGEYLRNDTQLSRGSFDLIRFEGGLRLNTGDEIRIEVNDTDIGFTVIGEEL